MKLMHACPEAKNADLKHSDLTGLSLKLREPRGWHELKVGILQYRLM